jgi:hypothetical protein
MGDLRNPLYFLFSERQVMAAIFGERRLCFYQVEEVEERTERVIDFVRESCRHPALLRGRSLTLLFCYGQQGTQ